ncbi:MAG TPA: Tat pathway signal protein [Bryobacteraceae bacterium]|jgi:hypothetical protein|nr:Tat pathway signal protein [Bryobacteraceae bacterium]
MTRREFVADAAAATVSLKAVPATVPWYRRTYRWGQTNITENDPPRYDIPWWREFWKRTEVQGVIINGGGIVAYYPSKFPLQHRAEFLNGRDLYGDLCKAAADEGLVVLARMDSNRTSEDFFRAHPDWFTRNAAGEAYRAADKYITCVNSPYYDEYIPDVMREIIGRSHPVGITDNSWSGLDRNNICYCSNCIRRFRDATGQALPKQRDWNDPVFLKWIDWNYARRVELWDANNRVTKAAGGPDCLWIGMNSGSIAAQSRSFRDCKAIWERTAILMLDHQARDATGFQENSDAGKKIHGVMGWEKLIPESMAMYAASQPISFRLASKPAPEARLWMLDGIAGGLQPWWHYVSAYQEDRRMYHTPEPVMRFHKENEEYLVNRQPVATVGLVWSQRNTDVYGRDEAAESVELPYHGFRQALLKGRIPYIPLNIDHVARESGNLRTLILPDIAVLSDTQCAAIRDFVRQGGSLIATGSTSLYGESGTTRNDFALGDLFGANVATSSAEWSSVERQSMARTVHTYLRLSPELRSRVWGPETGKEPPIVGTRHAALRGFDETDILPFGGILQPLRVAIGAIVPLTFIPEFPIYPPETAWMRRPKTDIPGLVIRDRVAFLPADIDRRYGRYATPDHGDLLINLIRWAAGESIPLHVDGRGLIDCSLYSQPGRLVLHLVNLTAAGSGRAPLDDLVQAGPLSIRVRLPQDVSRSRARLLVAGRIAPVELKDGWSHFETGPVWDHEVVVIE